MQEQAYRLGSEQRFFTTEARRITEGALNQTSPWALCRSGEFVVAQSASEQLDGSGRMKDSPTLTGSY